MTPLEQRRCVSIHQKLASLGAEFLEWRRLTRPGTPLEKHHRQVRALAAHLSGLRLETKAIYREAKSAGILEEARNIESLILGIRRIWEFFRTKLMQRRDDEIRSFLQLADELAWACYKPVLELAGEQARREPPLVFLNGGLSPYALSRDNAFTAESVPGEALASGTWDPILRKLPIPVIGVPWYQTAHIPDLPVVAHETGHTVEQDFGLEKAVSSAFETQLNATPGAANVQHWKSWSHEIFADIWGCLTLGPAFVSSLMEFLAAAPAIVDNEVASAQGKYPTVHLRMALCLEALRQLQFNSDADALQDQWKQHFNAVKMIGFEADVSAICAAILDTEYDIGARPVKFCRIRELAFTPADWKYAQEAAEKQRRGRRIDPETTAPQLVAAARFSFDNNPGVYAKAGYNAAFKEHIGSIVRPGIRAGERTRSTQQMEESAAGHMMAGREWFGEFARWAGAPRQT